MIKINPLMALSLASTLAGDLVEASADGVISIEELIKMGLKIAEQVGIPVDTKGLDLSKLGLSEAQIGP